MISPSGSIYKAFINALSGLVYKSNTIPVYSYPPQNAPNFYIQLGTITTVEEGCKDLFGHEVTMDIQVITQYDGNYATPVDAEGIASLITQALKPTTTSVVNDIEDFKMIWLVLENGFNDGGLFETNRSNRRILQWRFYLDQNPLLDWILIDGSWSDSGIWIDSATWNDGV